jgi:hypothetical protein
MLRNLLFLSVTTAIAQEQYLIAPAPAFYPRAVSTASATYSAVETPNATARVISIFTGPPFVRRAVIFADSTPGADLANPHIIAQPDVFLCAFRHHNHPVYRIAVAASSNGIDWDAPVVVTSGILGVWEPFLFSTAAHGLMIAFAAELPAGADGRAEQDISFRASSDGRTWGPEVGRIHTPDSRNGMPGVAVLSDGSWLAVFEGFWGPAGWGHYTVNAARSFDGGRTWIQRAIVHAPAPVSNSGSPQILRCSAPTERVCVVFMSNEGQNGRTWPDGATLVTRCASVPPGAAPIDWQAAVAGNVSTITPTAYWPGLFGVNGSLTYQSADGSALLQEGATCR